MYLGTGSYVQYYDKNNPNRHCERSEAIRSNFDYNFKNTIIAWYNKTFSDVAIFLNMLFRSYIKISIIFCLLFFSQINFAWSYSEIRAENNAYRHNNKGLIYLKENYYFGAIREFQIAIDLMPDAQGSAVYYINLGTTYDKIGYPELALPCYEKALSLHPLFFDYYKRVAAQYNKLGIAEEKLDEYLNKEFNPLNNIMIGLLYIQKGDINVGITILDDFCNNEKELLVTKGVREYIEEIIKDNV